MSHSSLRKLTRTIVVLLACAAGPPLLFAHEGHSHGPEIGTDVITTGPVAITAEAKTNLALQVEEAELRTLDKTLTVIGHIEAIPSRSAAVSSRIAGRVVDIKAMEGQTVKKGEPLIEVESLQVGNPPPRVTYSAPIDGTVTHRDLVLNASVQPDTHLLEIVDMSDLYAEGQIFEGQVARVQKGQKVRVSVESFPGETFDGLVELIGGSLDPQTRTLKVWVHVANPELRLRPNMRATLNIVTDAAESVIAVPHSAVLGEAGNLFAFVQTDEEGLTYERRPVVTGIRDDKYVEIVEGVYPTDKVVTLGNYQLQYVTAAPAANAEDANPHDAPPAAAPGAGRTVLTWMIGAAVLLLALNLLAIFMRGRSHATEAS
ncbi:MAG: efflux RND transporter periplasmic adaptor subunit [Chthoniobacterales bacterium]|nr:efflux RND transporter periplasmic adaptor subunit [Chthoniobacterales bacterium]